MRFLISVILIALLAFALGLYMPWWTIAIAAFIIPFLVYQAPGLSFLCGFTAIFLLWAILSWIITASNDHILAPRIARVLPLGGSVAALVLVTALVGGLVGGFAAMTGSMAARIRKQ